MLKKIGINRHGCRLGKEEEEKKEETGLERKGREKMKLNLAIFFKIATI